MALRNIYDADPLRHNDDEYRHQIVTLVQVINDAPLATRRLLWAAATPVKIKSLTGSDV